MNKDNLSGVYRSGKKLMAGFVRALFAGWVIGKWNLITAKKHLGVLCLCVIFNY